MRISRVREKVKSAAARWRLGRWKTAQIAFAKVFPSIERDPVVDISGCCDITTRSVALPMTDGADTAGEIAVSLFKSETDCSSAVAVRAPAGTPIGEVRCRTAPPRAALLGPAMPLSLHSARRRPAAPPPRGRPLRGSRRRAPSRSVRPNRRNARTAPEPRAPRARSRLRHAPLPPTEKAAPRPRSPL